MGPLRDRAQTNVSPGPTGFKHVCAHVRLYVLEGGC